MNENIGRGLRKFCLKRHDPWWALRIFALIIFVLIVGVWFIRLVLPSQIDDVSPGISCDEELLEWADVYFVIPKFEGVEIEGEWCNKMKMRDKELVMHGVYHTYEEFGIVRDEVYFDEGVDIFRTCFGQKVERFKPGQLAWDSGNDWIKDGVDVELFWNQFFHKVYHCEDTGMFPNWIVRIF